ncbi:MAG: hypothetical protein ACLRSY_07040 [Acutalibacter sp.]
MEDQVLQIDLETQAGHPHCGLHPGVSAFDITPGAGHRPLRPVGEKSGTGSISTLQYDESDNSIIVSSRETSTIIKCALGKASVCGWPAAISGRAPTSPVTWRPRRTSTTSTPARRGADAAQEVEALG